MSVVSESPAPPIVLYLYCILIYLYLCYIVYILALARHYRRISRLDSIRRWSWELQLHIAVRVTVPRYTRSLTLSTYLVPMHLYQYQYTTDPGPLIPSAIDMFCFTSVAGLRFSFSFSFSFFYSFSSSFYFSFSFSLYFSFSCLYHRRYHHYYCNSTPPVLVFEP